MKLPYFFVGLLIALGFSRNVFCDNPSLRPRNEITSNDDCDRFKSIYLNSGSASVGVYKKPGKAAKSFILDEVFRPSLDTPLPEAISPQDVADSSICAKFSEADAYLVVKSLGSDLNPYPSSKSKNGMTLVPIIRNHAIYYYSERPQPYFILRVQVDALRAFLKK